jgi:Fe-S-cluster containining protein
MSGWSVERRKQQSAAIHRWRPWACSTGPRTIEGKRRASQNARKTGGTRADLRKLARIIRDELKALDWSGHAER